MGLPFKLVSLQGLWFITSLMALILGVAHSVLAMPIIFSKDLLNKLGPTVSKLFIGVFLMIAMSYCSTLIACIGGWWNQAKKSNSKWTMFFAFILLSDSVHYCMYCALFVTAYEKLFPFPCLLSFLDVM